MSTRISTAEFIALIAVMFATIAFSIDAMLPALPEIARELSPDEENRAQLILTSFVAGMGIGTFFTGPLSDAFGRKPVIVVGVALYIFAAILAWASTSLETILAARVLQGIGAAAPRIVAVAVVRDLYSGRQMARIMSIAMMIFTLFPAVAPALGAGIIAFSGWRGVFVAFVVFACIMVTWMGLRLDEPLPRENRRPFRASLLWSAVQEMFRNPTVRLSIAVQTLCLGILFTMLTMVQPVYDVIFDREETFPFWFGAVALVSGTASLLNAAVVVRLGMRRLVTWALGAQIVLSGGVLFLNSMALSDMTSFALFVVWQASVFAMVGITLGNLNAIAMEPMGHIAGMAASVIGAISTVLAALIAAPIGLFFDGTLLPLTAGIFIMSVLAFLLMLQMARVEQSVTA
ncbi:multidrug effflux MFS transporter [Ruegeria sp. 2012CJ41-6]|uniref:Multidrug effflux MFS transporter n=1 Tax=Ruegeria spongiae TaxID=2942209 RepID=A0ABT0PWP7_9RHOB|nr:multidrug effflux MFS transporter [Ruegeria spongiae]MCL6282020.1 multidrug effflux MFS transporter [Ruegeria spongiae]